jgi:glycosyltransferase involved in cell wall biosynthesis
LAAGILKWHPKYTSFLILFCLDRRALCSNPAALADAIIELLDNDDMRETIVNNATKALGSLDWKVLSRELIEFIKK